MTWRATILTLYPEMFPGPLGASLSGKALGMGTWSLEIRNIREHGIGVHRVGDDTPAGGGALRSRSRACERSPSGRAP